MSQAALSADDKKLCLLAALLLPLRQCAIPGAKPKDSTSLPSYIVRESLKWKGKDAELVGTFHAQAPALLAVCKRLTTGDISTAGEV